MKDLKQSIRGARDLYPYDLAIRNWLFKNWRRVAGSFGYQEIDGPILENFDLFAVKSGDELVNRQMYTLKDRDDRKLGLRPELTPTFSRMVAKKQGQLTFPLRWTMFGNAWRYERPQKGRVRDFWQWELNIVGGEETLADAEVIALAATAMKSIGLTSNDIVFRINDRRFMQKTYDSFGIEKAKQPGVSGAIDKLERSTQKEFADSLKELGLSSEQVVKLNDFLKKPDYKKFEKLDKLFKTLDKYGVTEYIKYDPLIVRGLDYYTGTVFECFDKSREFRSIFGGGRFDDLVETFGGGKVPAVGFAVGDVVVAELLKKRNKLPELSTTPTDVLVTIFSANELEESLKIAQKMRLKGINTEIYPNTDTKMDKQLKYADKKRIPFVIIIGPDEAKNDQVTLKNMTSGKQTTLSLNEALEKLS